MNRSAQLEFCQKCTKRDFSPKKGIICSLTQEQATFNGTCVDFDEDEKEAKSLENIKISEEKEQIREQSLGMSSLGIKNGIVAGIITMVGALVWFILGLIYLDSIFLYPPILFCIGVYTLVKGIIKRKKEKLQENAILDSEI